MKSLISILLFGVLASTTALAGTYKWVDEDGNVVYSQHPPPQGKYEAIKVKPSQRHNPAAGQSADRSKKFLDDATSNRKNQAKLKAENEKNLALRKKNCDTAKQQLQFYTVYRRKKNDQGEYVRVTDAEREAGLTESRAAIKEFCD